MGRAGRYAGGFVALCSLCLIVTCGEPFGDAYCEAIGKGNQQTLELLTNVLERKRNQPGLYLARARCCNFLGSYAQALQDASEVIRQQNVYESLRNSGFNDQAKAGRTDGSKC